MGRTESHQAAEQGMHQSAEDQKRAGASYTAANKSLDDYSKSLDSFMRFGRSTYGANGEYARDQNTIATGAAEAGSNKIAGDMALNAMRTGDNTANYAPALAESTRAASRDLTQQLATSDSDRLSKLTAINQYGVQASALPAQVQSTLYGTGTSGAGSQLSSGADAAKTPGFWDVFAPALAGAAGTAAAGFCPCEGSLIRLADGREIPVEMVSKGMELAALGNGPPNLVTDGPIAVYQPCIEIRTRGGLTHEASRTHAVALARGGYARMYELLGQRILVAGGFDEVISVRDLGDLPIYPMAVDGSHSYMADGIWCFS